MSRVSAAVRSKIGLPMVGRLTRAGMPWPLTSALFGMGCASLQPIDTARRISAAAMRKKSRWSDVIPRESGYALLSGENALPRQYEFAAEAEKIARTYAAEHLSKKDNNPFYPLLGKAVPALKKHPMILDFILSDAVLDAVIGYFGAVPRLAYTDMWLTLPNTKTSNYNSQLAHLDKPEVSILTLFLALSDIKKENGPFTFLPADLSEDIVRATNYRYSYYSSEGEEKAEVGGRIPDDALVKFESSAKEVAVDGPKGAAAFVDTSRCVHFGSRCEIGERLMFVARFMPAHRGGFPMGFEQLADGYDATRRLILGAQ